MEGIARYIHYNLYTKIVNVYALNYGGLTWKKNEARVEKLVQGRFADEVLIEISEIDEIKNAETEFHANFEFIRSIIPQRYLINLLQLESTMMHIRISGEEHAYRAGLYDGMNIGRSS